MSKEKILIVDDEPDILELIKYNLSKEGYSIDCAKSGEEALEKSQSHDYDLIILDLMLPGRDGLDVCKVLKNSPRTSNVPIIMLTAKGEDADIVSGLEVGADDYVVKPFSPRVLLARIKAVIRRRERNFSDEQTVITINEMISINTGSREVFVNEAPLELTASEYKILMMIGKRPGWVFTRNQIINSVKGDDYPVTERSVDVQIVNLRKKLGDAGKYIETVRGVGYRLKE